MQQAEPQMETTRKKTVKPGIFSSPVKRFLAAWRKHPQYKIIALIIGLGLWIFQTFAGTEILVERTFQNVSVSIIGQDTLRSNGFIIRNDFSSEPILVTIRVKVPWHNLNTIKDSDYAMRINLTDLNNAVGEQSVAITPVIANNPLGIVTEVYPPAVSVTVEQYTNSGSIPITAVIEGSSNPTLWYDPNRVIVSPDSVIVSGPLSLVSRVRRAEVVIQASDLSETRTHDTKSAPIALYDEYGEPIVSNQLRISSSSVTIRSAEVTLDVYPKKTVAVDTSMAVVGTPAAGYVIKSVGTMPRTITIAGSREVIDRISTIFAESPHDVSGKSAGGITESLRLRISADLQYSSHTQVVFTALIEADTRERTFKNVPIETEGLSASLSAAIEPAQMNVTLNGNYFDVEALRDDGVSLYVNAAELAEGTYELDVLCHADNVRQLTYKLPQPQVKVTITKR